MQTSECNNTLPGFQEKHPLKDGLVIGECFRFIMYDQENKKTYLHYFTKQEVWDFIEINFMTTLGEFYRTQYQKLFGRDFVGDYYLFARYGVDVGELTDDPFIHRCFKAYGIQDIEMVFLKHPAFPTYVMETDGTWLVQQY